MDPRMKLKGVSLVLGQIGTNLGIFTLPSSDDVYDSLTTMYAKYDSKFHSSVASTVAPLTYSTSGNDEFWNFVSSNRVLDERRSRLAPDILDCLICLKDWEDARLGIQKRSAKDEFRGYFADSDIDSD
ncbi:hypothetical protein RHMOL_Rhmol09G0107100 [Rhododendron molle]|uniref:Uncharacterized protein n=1 Tax=Rhododendron molle TaxID=49168 RepID=A0ACC0MBZ4_RHOML|nr:hypothetical protein RHMOL_Rhmol09G0107100 [Rhododendron molle]